MKFLTLESPIRWLFLCHALLGAIALALLMIPLLSKKGGRIHVRVGWLYTLVMVLVGFSAMMITPWRILIDSDRTPESQSFSLFLFFIAVFTLAALSFGISAIKLKERKTSTKSPYQIGPPILLILFGLITMIAGINRGSTLLIVFPLLTLLSAKAQLTYWLTPPKKKMHWWYAHMNGMCTACIATVTAFLVTALPRLWPTPFTNSPVLWIAPGVIFGAMLSKWTAKYQAQFQDK